MSDEIYPILRQAILEERLSPGVRIIEERLARELGVSRIPVREALHKLESDGFVETSAYIGFRVPAFDVRRIGQLYDIRELLEIAAAEKARGTIDQAADRRHEAMVERMEVEVAAGNERAVVELHAEFHRALYAAGDNPRLAAILGPYIDLGFRYGSVKQAGLHGWTAFFDDHRTLAAVLRDGGPGDVEQVVRAHIATERRLSELAVAGEGVRTPIVGILQRA